MKTYIVAGLLLLMLVAWPGTTKAQTSDVSQVRDISMMMSELQSLMKQVEALQAQLATLRGEIKNELKVGLREGVTDEDIKKVQELLATDPTLYPRGLVTGYFGPLTKEAVIAFQKRHGLEGTGEVDVATKTLMLEYFKEKTNGQIPPGLLRAPGIDKKIMERLKQREDGSKYLDCEEGTAEGVLCKDRKIEEKLNKVKLEKDQDKNKNRTRNASSSSTIILQGQVSL
jgi:peptidoglycan hydrolase-like protein with peptidoglycan-binding domain